MSTARVEALGSPSSPGAIEVGPGDLVFLPLSAINEVAQVRQSYDPDGIRELARAMVQGEMPEGLEREMLTDEEISNRLVLLHPLTLGRFSSTDKAQTYLDDHAAHYGIDIPRAAESLEPADDGFYYLLITGHRRKRALQYLQNEFDIEDNTLRIANRAFDDIAFGEALGHQLRENVHDRPLVVDEARAIERYYNHLVKLGQFVSYKKLANELGMGEAKISAALAFAGLPESVQALAIGEKSPLSYTVVSKLRPLYDGYLRQYDDLVEAQRYNLPEDRITYAKEHVIIVANKITENIIDGGDKKSLEIIDAHLKQLRGEDKFTAETLFDVGDAESPSALRKKQELRIIDKILWILTHAALSGSLAPRQRNKMTSVLGSLTTNAILPDIAYENA
jgi:hypothetical protein